MLQSKLFPLPKIVALVLTVGLSQLFWVTCPNIANAESAVAEPAVAESPVAESAVEESARAETASGHHASVIPAQKEIIKFTEKGVEPAVLHLKDLDGSVFFLNATKESLVTFSVDFGSKRSHCASDNMKFNNGKLASVVPIAPKDFALTCFPERGSYPIEVFGLGKPAASGKAPTSFRGEIVVD